MVRFEGPGGRGPQQDRGVKPTIVPRVSGKRLIDVFSFILYREICAS